MLLTAITAISVVANIAIACVLAWKVSRFEGRMTDLEAAKKDTDIKLEIVNLGVVNQVMEVETDQRTLKSILDTQERLYNSGLGLKPSAALQEARRLHGLLP